jgi:2-amino-4-hydroxy-6-hydroxymethyldihydropteridine diphosphokinase
MSKVYLLLGGNLGDRELLMAEAEKELNKQIGEVVLKSSLYETNAWGKEQQPNFLNKILVIDTNLNAFETLKLTQAIELKLGRTRIEHWGARTMDIDILFYDNEIINTDNLKIPHPLITMRKFVLLPLLEIIPNFIHPVLKQTINELYLICDDQLNVGIKR